MFKIFYTTQMSSNARQLQARFTKMRSKSGCFSKTMAAVMAVMLMSAMLCATIAFAAIDGLEIKNGTLIIDGKSRGVDIIHIENELATHTDSFYVPLRDTFESLGYTIHYNVDKGKYQGTEFSLWDDFPTYSNVNNSTDYNEWLSSLVKTEVDAYIYGATYRFNHQMPIIEMVSPIGKTEYCQIGSKFYSSSSSQANAPILIDGKAYISIRAVAETIGGNGNVKWNDGAHDTYYEGAVEFDEESMTLSIETDWTKPAALSDMEARRLYADYDDMLRACYETIDSFFTAFEKGDGAAACAYGTREFLERQFNNNMLFYQSSAKRGSVYSIGMYTDGNMYVYAQIIDDYAKRNVMFRMAQQDGRYLIDDAETVHVVLHDEPDEMPYYDDETDVMLWHAE